MALTCTLLLLLWCVSSAWSGGPPTITSIKPGQVHMFSSGATSTLHCQVNESSTLVAIYYDNVPLETTPVSISNGGGAEIEISSRSDSGWYTCTATNSVGRIDVDFLIIFGDMPTFLVEPKREVVVREGTRVEFPCLASGLPEPVIQWFNGTDVELFGGENGGRYIIDPITNSLIIDNATVEDTKTPNRFRCKATNQIGSVSSRRANISFSNVALPTINNDTTVQLSTDLHSSDHLEILQGGKQNLTCLNFNTSVDITELSIVFRWTRNYVVVSQFSSMNQFVVDGDNPTLSGLYCCEVHQAQVPQVELLIDHYCVTVIVRAPPVIDFVSNAVSVHAGRTASLLATARTPSDFFQPRVSWLDGRNDPFNNTNSLGIVERNDVLFGYVRIDTGVASLPAPEVVGVMASNAHQSTTVNRVFVVIEPFGENALSDSRAQQASSNWVSSINPDAIEIGVVRNENVFRINYTGSGSVDSMPVLEQELLVPEDASGLFLSARLRRELFSGHSGFPIVRVMESGSTVAMEVRLPFDNSAAWQSVSANYSFTQGIDGISIQLTLLAEASGASLNVDTFFDDIHASFIRSGPPPPSWFTIGRIVALVVACVVIPILVVVVVVVICCCYAVNRSKDSGAVLMRKMTTKLGKPFTLKRKDVELKSYRMDQNEEDKPEDTYDQVTAPVGRLDGVTEEEEVAYYITPNNTLSPNHPLLRSPRPSEKSSPSSEQDEVYALADDSLRKNLMPLPPQSLEQRQLVSPLASSHRSPAVVEAERQSEAPGDDDNYLVVLPDVTAPDEAVSEYVDVTAPEYVDVTESEYADMTVEEYDYVQHGSTGKPKTPPLAADQPEALSTSPHYVKM